MCDSAVFKSRRDANRKSARRKAAPFYGSRRYEKVKSSIFAGEDISREFSSFSFLSPRYPSADPTGRHIMDTFRLGGVLRKLCKSKEDKVAEVNAMFESLTEGQLRKVLRYRDEVSESRDSDQRAVYDGIPSSSAVNDQLFR